MTLQSVSIQNINRFNKENNNEMKIYTVTLVLIFSMKGIMAQESFFNKADQLFDQHVLDGKVDYESIKQEPKLLADLVQQIGNMSLAGKSDNFVKAFYINAYNILTIQQVVERYPVKGPMQVAGFFDRITHSVAGEKLTLNQLEKEVLFKKYPDNRIHFALVCAANGCPPLASYAFHPDKLDQQLNKITQTALSDESFIRIDQSKQRVYLSQIFEWYRQDFMDENKDLVSYINQFRNDRIPSGYKVRFYEYDWTLNDV